MDIDADQIKLEDNLVEDLKADSLDVVELVMDLEQDFEIEIQEDDLAKITTVKDIVDYVEKNI